MNESSKPRDTLAGLSVPSVLEIVEEAVEASLPHGAVDLSSAFLRGRLKERIARRLALTVEMELRHVLIAANRKAIEHVIRLMRDPDYQKKREQRRQQQAQRRKEKKEQREEAARQARMDYSRRHLEVHTKTIN